MIVGLHRGSDRPRTDVRPTFLTNAKMKLEGTSELTKCCHNGIADSQITPNTCMIQA